MKHVKIGILIEKHKATNGASYYFFSKKLQLKLFQSKGNIKDQ